MYSPSDIHGGKMQKYRQWTLWIPISCLYFIHRPKHSTSAMLPKTTLRSMLIVVVFLVTSSLLFREFLYDFIQLGPSLMLYKYGAVRNYYVCSDMMGGLGNRLFQYAFVYGMSKRHNLSMVCKDEELQTIMGVFQLPACTDSARSKAMCFLQRAYLNKKDSGYDTTLSHVMENTDYHYRGYFQSWKYWKPYEKEIRKLFKLKPQLKLDVETRLNKLLKRHGYSDRKFVTLVGIHIRRGDIIEQDVYRNFGYNVVSTDYIVKAKEYIQARVNGPIVYVVSSNDGNWTKHALYGTNAIFVTSDSSESDFATLSICDHFIMSVGTFGWWVGWQIKGMVLFYSKPFKPGSRLEQTFTNDYLETFFYNGWVGLS